MIQLRDHRGRRVVAAAAPFAEGGEAFVHEVLSDTTVVAKLYKPGKATPQRWAKLEAMLARPPVDPTAGAGHVSIAWPVALLSDPRGHFVGFTMPRVDTIRSRQIGDLWIPRLRVQGVTWKHMVRIVRNVASAVAAVHARGHVIGDLNDRNILVSHQGLVTLVDCDSMQVVDPRTGAVHRCEVGVAEFTPPELLGIELSTVDRHDVHDRFGLAVVLFRQLMEGRHPFGNSANPTIAANIAQNQSFLLSNRVMPPVGTPPLEILPAELRQLFGRCFGDGHRDPRRRPTAAEWHASLRALDERLVQCRRDPLHWHGGHQTACPWCALSAGRVGSSSRPHAAPRPAPVAAGPRSPGTTRRPMPQRHVPAGAARPHRASAQPTGGPGAAPTPAAYASTAPGPAQPWMRNLAPVALTLAVAVGWIVVQLLRGLAVVGRYLWRLVPRRHRALAAAIAAALLVVSWQAWSDSRHGAVPIWPVLSPFQDNTIRIVPLSPNGPSAADPILPVDTLAALGGVVALPAGTHDVTEPIVVQGSLVITGSGRTSTVLRYVGEGTFLTVAEGGSLRLEGVTLARTSRTPGSVVRVDAGRADLFGVTLMGGASGEAYAGAGLLVVAAGQAAARDSSFEGNASGVVAIGTALVELLRCEARGNSESGLYFRDRVSATVDRCTVRDNGRDGIALGGDAVVEVHRATVEANAQRGISFLGSARGTVSETRIIDNGFGRGGDDYWQGIGVQDRSAPVLRANEVRGNAGVGIQYLHAAGGLARANTVTGNAVNRAAYAAATGLEAVSAGGIALGRPGQGDAPDPVLEANRVVRNAGGDVMDYREMAVPAGVGGG